MPVRVRVPTRIRTDIPALTLRQATIGEAVGAAVERALRHSRRAVVEPRGEQIGLTLKRPEFFWWGSAIDRVGPELRNAVEEDVAEAIAAASVRAHLRRQATQPATGAEGERIAEALRHEDYDEDLGWYTVPSYDVATPKVQVPVQRGRRGRRGATGADLAGWPKLTARRALQLFVAALKARGLPPPPLIGAIFHRSAGGGLPEGLYVVIVQFASHSAKEVFTGRLGGLISADALATGEPDIKPTRISPSGAFRLVRFAQAGSETQNRAALEKYFRPLLRAKFQANRIQYASEEDFTKNIDDVALKQLVDSLLPDVAPGATTFLELLYGAGSALVPTTNFPSEIDDVELIPLGGSGEAAAGAEGPGGEGGVTTGAGAEGAGGVAGGEPGGEGEALAQLVFPPAPAEAEAETLECDAYLGEPSIDALGDDGKAMRGMISAIASRLQIDGTCPFAGQFLLNAAEALGKRAMAIGMWSGPPSPTQATPGRDGNLGHLHFTPTASPQIVFLRHLAQTTSYISVLFDTIHRVYQANGDKIEGTWSGRPLSWLLRFDHDMTVAMGSAVGDMFAMACQVLFLQLLTSSREAIQKRLTAIDNYAANFEKYVLPQLQLIEELGKLREKIEEAKREDQIAAANAAWAAAYAPRVSSGTPSSPQPGGSTPAAAPPRASTWKEARQQVTDSLAPQPQTLGTSQGHAYEVIRDGDSYRVRDTKGKLWDLTGIENITLIARGNIEDYEPLVKQFFDLPDVMERIRNPKIGLKAELRSILDEMLQHNLDKTSEAQGSPYYGFRASKISENVAGATVTGTSYQLTGIHKVAHEQIGEWFEGDRWYRNGIDFLFSAELGKQELKSFLIFAGLVLLAVVCPEAALIVGIVVAEVQLAEAVERKALYQALIDPDKVLTRAEVEADLFAAELGLVLAFLPVFAEAGAEARAALRAVSRSGLEAAEAGAARAAATEAAALMTRTLATGVIERFAVEFAKAAVIQKVISAAIEPIVRGYLEQRELTGPIGGVEGAMQALIRRQRARARKS